MQQCYSIVVKNSNAVILYSISNAGKDSNAVMLVRTIMQL